MKKGRVGRFDHIREGGYQPTSDAPPPPTGYVPPEAVNPITTDPPPADHAGDVRRPSSPPARPGADD